MCCRPAGPTAASPHFDKDEKQAPCPVPTHRCRHCPSPPGCRSHHNPLKPQRRAGSVEPSACGPPALPQPCSRAGDIGEPSGRAGNGQHRERCFGTSCLLMLPVRLSRRGALTSDPPSCWTPPAPATSAKCVSTITSHDKCRYQPWPQPSVLAPLPTCYT